MHASGVSHYRYSDKAKESIYLQVRTVLAGDTSNKIQPQIRQKIHLAKKSESESAQQPLF